MKGRSRDQDLGEECGASITWMAAGEASGDICSLLGLGVVCVFQEYLAGCC
jgi:hypothetical protein